MYILKGKNKTICFGRIWPSSGFMSIKISLYKLRELRYDVEIFPSNYCRNIRTYWRILHISLA